MAAMIYQIDQDSKSKVATKKQQVAIKHEDNKKSGSTLSGSGAPLDPSASKVLNEYFDDIFNQLSIEHNLKETAYRHQLDSSKRIVKQSPYQQVYNENDRLGQLTHAFTFLNGDNLTTTELKALQHS
jgi:hypothetical protein